MTAAALRIQPYFHDGDIDYLFDSIQYSYEKMYATTFVSRKNVNLDEPMKLAMELPAGAFIAGGFMKSIAHGETPKDYDLFFNSSETLKTLVKRIHNAPEGSFLHGYTSSDSVLSFADGDRKYMMFTHPAKPPLQLVRVRWYSRVEEAIDKFDFTMSQFALDSELNITFGTRSWDDASMKVCRLLQAAFPLSTGLRIERFFAQGWIYQGDTYLRDDYVRLARDYLVKLNKASKKLNLPIVVNSDGFGSFETYGEV